MTRRWAQATPSGWPGSPYRAELDFVLAVDGRVWISKAEPDNGQAFPLVAVATLRHEVGVFDCIAIVALPDGAWLVRGVVIDGRAADASHLLDPGERRRLAAEAKALLEEPDPKIPINGGRLA
jgi:hypothetical protein